MATISVSLPSDGQTIDAADVNTPINTIVAAINGNLNDDNIVSGAAINGTKLLDSSITNVKMSTEVKPVTLLDETTFDFVASGGVWTADSVGVNLNASMTAMIIYINGRRISIATVTARAFTLNVDTYIDVLDNADGTGLLVYTTAATNAASPALASNSVRIGIIQAAATITAATKVNQGQEDKVFPIASSIPYAVTDSLGNLICPRDPQRRVLGLRQRISNFTFTTNATVTELVVPVIVPVGRKIRVSVYSSGFGSSSVSNLASVLYDGATTGGTQINRYDGYAGTAGGNPAGLVVVALVTPTTASKTYSVSAAATAGTGTLQGSATAPLYITVELV